MEEHVRPFPSFLAELNGGEAADELTAAMAELVSAVEFNQGGGSLSLRIDIKPNKGGRGVFVCYDINSKLPKMGKPASMYFAVGGVLTREDPRQMNFEDLTQVGKNNSHEETINGQ